MKGLLRLTASVALASPACGTTDSSEAAKTRVTDESTRDASINAAIPPDALPPEKRYVTLTLWPLYDWQESEAGFGGVVPIDGAEVCVERVRPWGGAWKDFREWDERFPERARPCVVTEAEEGVVLEGVPARSELLVVASKEGYRPSVFPVVTGGWDMDATTGPDASLFRMVSEEARWPTLPVAVNPDLGWIRVTVFGCVLFECAQLGRAVLTLDTSTADGPFFGRGGLFNPSLERTLPASSSFTGFIGEDPLAQGTKEAPTGIFVNLPEGEYELRIDHNSATCEARGSFDGHGIYGFPSNELNVIRVPVLPGHTTPAIAPICRCVFDRFRGSAGVEPSTCRRVEPDGGATP